MQSGRHLLVPLPPRCAKSPCTGRCAVKPSTGPPGVPSHSPQGPRTGARAPASAQGLRGLHSPQRPVPASGPAEDAEPLGLWSRGASPTSGNSKQKMPRAPVLAPWGSSSSLLVNAFLPLPHAKNKKEERPDFSPQLTPVEQARRRPGAGKPCEARVTPAPQLRRRSARARSRLPHGGAAAGAGQACRRSNCTKPRLPAERWTGTPPREAEPQPRTALLFQGLPV